MNAKERQPDDLIEQRIVTLRKILFPTAEEKAELEFLEEHLRIKLKHANTPDRLPR